MIVSFRSVATATLLFLCTACQKEIGFDSGSASGSGTAGSVNGVFKMKVNGVQWTADRVAGASILGGIINLTGIEKDKKYFIITLSDTVTGTYVLNTINLHAAALIDSSQANPGAYTTNQSDDTTLSGGTVTVTAIDKTNKTISGRFACKVFRESDSSKVVITEGIFDKLSYATTLPVANTTDTLYVKVDGVLWNAKSIITLTNGGTIIINGTELNLSRGAGLQMPEKVIAGTYAFTFFGDYTGTYAPNSTTALIADSGKITIIEHNLATKRIRGNFNFKANPIVGTGTTYNLTEGYFSVKTQ